MCFVGNQVEFSSNITKFCIVRLSMGDDEECCKENTELN